jgi:cation diffusion facilitator CzcD-associated flavoprotein CzcO
MEKFIATARTQARGLIGTWVKIPSLATLELLGHAGFDFVVIDMEHAPHAPDRACELIFAAQAVGMAALGPCWGLGSGTPGDPGPWEGELRNMWKPAAQEGLWFQGGNLMQARFHSLHLALQIKARMEKLNAQVYSRPG